jgi:integrase
MTAPRTLTEPYIRSLPPAPAGQRYAVSDALVPGLRVRVTDTGSKSFILWKRYGGAAHPAARSLGSVGELTLAQAREKARSWIAAIKRGEDPCSARDAAVGTFGAVAEDYLRRHVAGQRRASEVERDFNRELLPRWRGKPLSAITRKDVIKIIDEINSRGAKYQAHTILTHCKVFFAWAVEHGHIEASPAALIKPSRLIGAKEPRQRVLTDTELAVFWRAARRMQYPMGPLLRMLLLTGQRKSEVAEARWHEFNLETKLWTIPPERFKSDAVHVVPLTDDVIELLKDLPRWRSGDYLFSTTGGRKAVNGFSKAKERLDERMLRTLKAMARRKSLLRNSGRSQSDTTLQPFVLHDLRRTVRTRLSSLRIADPVSEAVIGHSKKGLLRVYNQHRYLDEMREALTAWATHLRGIIEPVSNVVPLRGVR